MCLDSVSFMYTECSEMYRKSVLQICLSIPQIYTLANAVQICGKFWGTQYSFYKFASKFSPPYQFRP